MKDIADFFKVLSDPARVQILWLLTRRPELCVCDIMGTLEITQSKASRHLATLRHAGLVSDRREGAWSYYSLTLPSSGLGAGVIDVLYSYMKKQPQARELAGALERWLSKKPSCGCSVTDFDV